MSAIAYGTGAYRRTNGQFPELKLVNYFVEKTPVDNQQPSLLGRKGLELSSTVGSGAITGLFQQDGAFSGELFVLSGGELYRNGVLVGTVPGSGPVSFACSGTELLITAGGDLYSYNGTNLAVVAFPDSALVAAIAFIAGLFVAVRANSQKFYWSAPLDGRSWGALDFASAELSPDNLLEARVSEGSLFLFGSATVECWFPNGTSDLPFTRVAQRLYEKGVKATGCVANLDNAMFWVGNDSIVYRSSDVPQRISDHSMEERIGVSSAVSCYSWSFEGHYFFCVRLDTGTFSFDVATQQWCEFASYGRPNFRALCAVNIADIPYFGDDASGELWVFGDDYADDGDPLEASFTAGVHSVAPFTVDRLDVMASVGSTSDLTLNPMMEMRSSRDGRTWNNFRGVSMGATGGYRTRVQWRRCGMFDNPGALFEFRTTDQGPRRISGVFVNEVGGGRSR